jgi:hypothetical protein
MFANPLWSVLILLALVGVYIVIRIKHGKPLFQAFSGGAWLDNWIAWLVAFRSWVAGAVAGLLVGLPDILVTIIPGLDLTWLIGENWSKIVLGALSTFLTINAAFKTKPDGVKAADHVAVHQKHCSRRRHEAV